jgi:lipopolysaccharide/colanic/teichoic acid biosynthesis glycosyltransferase
MPFDTASVVAVRKGTSSSTRAYLICKRALDVLLATSLLIFFLPLMALIALLIKIDSPGPALYVQARMGAKPAWIRRGIVRWRHQPFRFYKFRSMQHECDQELHRSYIRDAVRKGRQPQFKLTHDERVTRLGRILRRTSLDELPQLFNVIRGDMSLVGPRPVPLYEAELYDTDQQLRLNARPGITGLWQISARGSGGVEKMISLDIAYINSASLLQDLEILLRTVPAVLAQRGAE